MKKELAILIVIAAIVMPAIVSAQTCPAGMVSYWKFDEGGGDIPYDSVGENHGTITGAQFTSGKVGQALSFDGNDYVDNGNDPSLLFTGSFTVLAWVKNYAPEAPTIVCRYSKHIYGDFGKSFCFGFLNENGENPGSVYLGVYNVPLDPIYASDAGYIYTVNSFTSVTDWYQVTGVYDSSAQALKIYVNGNLGPSITTGNIPPSMPVNDTPVTIGAFYYIFPDPNTLLGWAKGEIDEVAIYDRALSAEERPRPDRGGKIGKAYSLGIPKQ